VNSVSKCTLSDGHPGNSSPLDEQDSLVRPINFLQAVPERSETAAIITYDTYDDSNGWYEHVIGPIVKQSTYFFESLWLRRRGNGAGGAEDENTPGHRSRAISRQNTHRSATHGRKR